MRNTALPRTPSQRPAKRSTVEAKRLGEKVRLLREARGWSQSGLAWAIGGKKHGVISRIERGQTSPNADTILRLAELFNVTPNVLLCDEVEIPAEALWPE